MNFQSKYGLCATLYILFAGCASNTTVPDIETFQKSMVPSHREVEEYYKPTETDIERVESYLGAALRIYHKDRDIEVEIANLPDSPAPQMWERDEAGREGLYVYWIYHIWHRGIHKHCDKEKLDEITTKARYCIYRAEVEPPS